jgi:phage terminase large subunit GpA-like protein
MIAEQTNRLLTLPANLCRLFRKVVQGVAPPPALTVSEWADSYRKLSPEASAEPGQWRTSRAPFQREPMDALNDPYTETIVLMWSAQVGKTEIILNILGYHIDQDAAPVMLVQPTEALAEAFSKDRLAPMIRDTPRLRGKVRDVKSRDSGNTLLHKKFPGGHITLAGSNAPSSLASRPIRIVLLDEVDRYPTSAGTEGDPVNLVTKRTTTFWNRKRVMVSTPTIKGASRIEFAYEQSSMEQWCLPCPSCGEYQPLSWGQITYEYDEESRMAFNAEHACRTCGCLHREYDWKSGTGKWIGRKKNRKVRGFHLNELSSTFVSWEEVAQNHREAKRGGPEQLKTWTNTSMAETWEEQGEQVDDEQLLNRLEEYEAELPDWVRVLTAAVDVQDDRFEVEVVGWGPGKESWGIEYRKIFGDLKQKQVWHDLDEFLKRTWAKKDGSLYGIACTCMDSGGHFTQEVYRFCAPKEARRVYAIKGKGSVDGGYVPLLNGHTRTKREKAILFTIGVDEGKNRVVSNLQIAEVGPNFCHFPKDRGYNAEYFKGLTAEKKVKRIKSGVPYYTWKKERVRNEPFDLRVYNTAALEILNPKLDSAPATAGKTIQRMKKRRKTLSTGL